LHSAMKAASSGLVCAAWMASGCSAATAQKVTPMMVSGRVVNTYSLPSPISAVGVLDLVREGEAHAGRLADPVGLHDAHALGPARQLVVDVASSSSA
jgi:hypothetical protein